MKVRVKRDGGFWTVYKQFGKDQSWGYVTIFGNKEAAFEFAKKLSLRNNVNDEYIFEDGELKND